MSYPQEEEEQRLRRESKRLREALDSLEAAEPEEHEKSILEVGLFYARQALTKVNHQLTRVIRIRGRDA